VTVPQLSLPERLDSAVDLSCTLLVFLRTNVICGNTNGGCARPVRRQRRRPGRDPQKQIRFLLRQRSTSAPTGKSSSRGHVMQLKAARTFELEIENIIGFADNYGQSRRAAAGTIVTLKNQRVRANLCQSFCGRLASIFFAGR